MSEKEKYKKEVQFFFLTLGIGSLLSWNTILTELDFFIEHMPKYNPATIFSNINFAINLTLQLILLSTKKIFSYKTFFITGLLFYISSMVALGILPIILNEYQGFLASCFFVFINGFGNAVLQSSMFALVAFFPIENTIAVGTGQGISGILMNIIRCFILFFSSVISNDRAANIFFGISTLILVFVLYQVIKIYSNPYFTLKLKSIGEIKGEKDEKEQLLEEDEGQELQNIDENQESQENKKENKGLLFLFYKIFDINFMIFLCYAITIGLYPGACLKPDFFNMSSGYHVNSIIFLYNIFDTLGRQLVSYIKKPSKKQLYLISFARILFLVLIPGIPYLKTKFNYDMSILTSISVSLMSLTNGVANNLCFALAPEQVEGDLKAKAGSSVSFFLAVGLFAGSLIGNAIEIITSNKN